MRSFTTRLAATCLAFAGAALAAGDPYNITVDYKINNQDVFLRAWYGDGNLYVGPTVPASVKVAFNFTVPNVRADLLYIEPTTPGVTLPDPTFLALNNAPGASDPLFFSHSAAAVTGDDLIFWFRYANLLFPIFNDGSVQSYFYLDETEAEGTYIVKWKQGGLKSPTSTATPGDLGGLGVQLTAVPPS